MDISFDFSQVDRLENDLAAGIVKGVAATRGIAQIAGQQVLAGMRADAPVRTGELVGSIRGELTAAGYEAGSDVEHGFYQEFGTSKMAPQPWAFHHADAAEQMMVDSLENISIL